MIKSGGSTFDAIILDLLQILLLVLGLAWAIAEFFGAFLLYGLLHWQILGDPGNIFQTISGYAAILIFAATPVLYLISFGVITFRRVKKLSSYKQLSLIAVATLILPLILAFIFSKLAPGCHSFSCTHESW